MSLQQLASFAIIGALSNIESAGFDRNIWFLFVICVWVGVCLDFSFDLDQYQFMTF